jgi:hypothetical protein
VGAVAGNEQQCKRQQPSHGTLDATARMTHGAAYPIVVPITLPLDSES